MNFEMDNIGTQLELLKENFEDLKEAQGWFDDECLPYDRNYLMTKDEALSYAHVHSKQMFDLLRLYINEFDTIIKEFRELEKASSEQRPNSTDNA
ncbi:type II toxin-antitoxin system toxin TscT [Staphylococcus arlettae]|uniref:type II toxin-antitoxin system toxin TscT n=1 Tax=Staphylococcus arlettae TaxID=29378 RepID=UPI0021D13C29|nr:DUF1474 family protein [Staphylococcus arlettae]UXU49144.1 DUF1474 family protein [Staphylococcus arlettae]